MHLEGTHRFDATREVLWELLNDPQVVGRATPGVKELQLLEEDSFRVVCDIKMGPVNSLFKGSLTIADKVELQRYRMRGDFDARIGTVAVEATIALEEEEGTTLVSFTGDARLTGVLARMGQRVLSGVGRMITNQFFKGLEEEIPRK